MSATRSFLRREILVSAFALVVITGLAWTYIWRGAGMGMSALQMTRLVLFPHSHPDLMAGMSMPPIGFTTVVSMWWVMMIGMMAPSAAPVLLLHARVLRETRGTSRVPFATLLVLAGYLSAWLVFSVVAASLQYAFERTSLISEMMLWSRSPEFSAAMLALAGIYQLSPIKQACLRHCRGPIDFLTRHARSNPFVLGAHHGAWCVGCCWVLMSVLFVVGVMNLVWIAALAILILLEKISAFGVQISRASGVMFIAWGVATLIVAQAGV